MKFDELVRILETIAEGKDYCVYMLLNDSKAEIYFGVTNDFAGRWQDHAGKSVESTAHWNATTDKIRYKIIASNLSQEEASRKAHLMEKIQQLFTQYKVIQTTGI